MADDLYKLMKNKQIIAILDGDVKYSEYKFIDDGEEIRICMPYLMNYL